MLAEIPHQLWAEDTEKFFHALIFLTFRLLGTFSRAEVSTARGRCDAVVETAERVYVIEFKLDRPAAEAIAQIRERGYVRAYADDGREVVLLGVRLDGARRAVGEYLEVPMAA